MANWKDQATLNDILDAHADNKLLFNKAIKDRETKEIIEIEQIKTDVLTFFKGDKNHLNACISTLNNVIHFCDNSSKYKSFFWHKNLTN